MDKVFEIFMKELRLKYGSEEDMMTSLCRDRSPKVVSELRHGNPSVSPLFFFATCLRRVSVRSCSAPRHPPYYDEGAAELHSKYCGEIRLLSLLCSVDRRHPLSRPTASSLERRGGVSLIDYHLSPSLAPSFG